MGAYHHVVCPAKRQYIDIGMLENPKRSGLMHGMHAQALGLLLCDERRSVDWPLSLVGSWAGREVFLPKDEETACVIGEDQQERLAYGIETGTPADPHRNLYWMATEEFEELSGAMVAMLAAVNSSVLQRVPELIERLAGTERSPMPSGLLAHHRPLIAQLQKLLESSQAIRKLHRTAARRYPNDETYLVVNPQAWQYIDPARLGEQATADGLFRGWHGILAGEMILAGRWRGPVYAAGESSRTNPCGGLAERRHRNLHALALANYEDVTYRCARGLYRLADLIRAAEADDAVLIGLGDLAFSEAEPGLREEMNRRLGVRWPKRYAEAYRCLQ